MNFTNFTNNKQANQDLSLFYNWFAHIYNKADILDFFGLSGQVAAVLQSTKAPIKNVTFITNLEEMVDIIKNQLPLKINTKGVIHQENNSYFIYENLIIDVYFQTDEINFVVKDGYNCQDIDDIPNFLL